MKIKPDYIDSLRDRADIVQIVGNLMPLKKSGVRWTGCCPFHDEKSPSFTVHPVRGRYKCFGCGASGDVFAFVTQFKKLDFPSAVKYVADQHNELPDYERDDRPRSTYWGQKL